MKEMTLKTPNKQTKTKRRKHIFNPPPQKNPNNLGFHGGYCLKKVVDFSPHIVFHWLNLTYWFSAKFRHMFGVYGHCAAKELNRTPALIHDLGFL